MFPWEVWTLYLPCARTAQAVSRTTLTSRYLSDYNWNSSGLFNFLIFAQLRRGIHSGVFACRIIRGRRWCVLGEKLVDREDADDIVLLFYEAELAQSTWSFDMRFGPSKCCCRNCSHLMILWLDSEEFEVVDYFIYSGSCIRNDGRISTEVNPSDWSFAACSTITSNSAVGSSFTE